jgi:ubiquinol-cytochrome c reductase core subunit 2
LSIKNTQRRSALRITRESELLGGQLSASHTREALILEASFLRDDLPFFAELLAEVISSTKYTSEIIPLPATTANLANVFESPRVP